MGNGVSSACVEALVGVRHSSGALSIVLCSINIVCAWRCRLACALSISLCLAMSVGLRSVGVAVSGDVSLRLVLPCACRQKQVGLLLRLWSLFPHLFLATCALSTACDYRRLVLYRCRRRRLAVAVEELSFNRLVVIDLCFIEELVN